MGQLMVFRRETLCRIGGVECAAGHLVDDMRIGVEVARASLRNVMIRRPLYLITGGLSFIDFVRLFRRWLTFSRDGLPAQFTAPNWARGALLYAAIATAAFAAGSGHERLLPLPLAVVAAWVVSQLALQRAFGGAPVPLRHVWVVLALPLLAPFLMISTVLHPRVAWRGRAYDLRSTNAGLAPGADPSLLGVEPQA
jgi:hypothetical protein